MHYTIRETQDSDYLAIRIILEKTGTIGTEFGEDIFRRVLASNIGTFFVAEGKTTILGTIFAHDGIYYGFISKVAVLPQYQNNGIGSALTQRVVEEFRRRNIKWHFGFVKNGNTGAERTNVKFGIVPQREYHLVDNWKG